MSKEEFIAKLQMVYVGDRNVFNELVSVYDNLIQKNIELNNINDKLSNALNSAEQRIDKAIEYLKETTFDFGTDEMIFDKCNAYTLLSILQGKEVKDNEI